MFDMTKISRNYFTVNLLLKSGKTMRLDVYNPSVNNMRALMAAQKSGDLDEVCGVIANIFSRNKQHRNVDAALFGALDYNLLKALMDEFLHWVQETRAAKN